MEEVSPLAFLELQRAALMEAWLVNSFLVLVVMRQECEEAIKTDQLSVAAVCFPFISQLDFGYTQPLQALDTVHHHLVKPIEVPSISCS